MFSFVSITYAAGTADDWSATLTFSTDSGDKDILPVKIGESKSPVEKLKPPPMPGIAYDDSYDPIVYGFVLNSEGVGAAKSIAEPDEEVPGKVWAVKVNVEVEPGQTKKVSLEANLDEFFSDYDLSVLIPDTKELIDFTQDGQLEELFEVSETTEKTVYVMAGTSKTFLASNGEEIFGAVRLASTSDLASGIDVYVNGQKKDTSEDGTFDLTSSLQAGNTYTIKLDAPYVIGKEFEVTIGENGFDPVMVQDLFGGDLDDSGKIDLKDIVPIKSCFLKNPDSDACNGEEICPQCDINQDGKIDLRDLAIIKPGFMQEEEF